MIIDYGSIEEEMAAAGCWINFPSEVMIIIGIPIMGEDRDIKEASWIEESSEFITNIIQIILQLYRPT